MSAAVNPWGELRRSEVLTARAAFEARDDFAALVDEAGRRGFRRITLGEQMEPHGVDAYAWRGGVWVKAQGATR